MNSRKPLTAGELEIDCGAFGKIRRASPPAKGDFAIKDGRLTLLGCIQRGLVTLSREELLPFLDAMDAQDAQIQTLNERIIELDLEAMEKCRRVDSLLTPPPDAAVREAVERLSAGVNGPWEGSGSMFADIRTLLRAVQPAPALPGDDGEICARLLSACTGHPHALIPWPHRLLHDAVSHITDLTRRLAEAEAAYKHVKQCLHISQDRAKRAEERIQELEDMRND